MKRQVKTKKTSAFSMAPLALRLLIIILAVLIVAVGTVTVSYSWFAPGENSGSGMALEETVSLRSENCSFKTYDQDNELVADNEVFNLSTGQIQYFTTVISNAEGEPPTNVSLYVQTTISGNNGIGVAYPTNSYHNYPAIKTNEPIVRNIYISKSDSSVIGAGYAEVKWFVKCNANNLKFSLNSLKPYITYN